MQLLTLPTTILLATASIAVSSPTKRNRTNDIDLDRKNFIEISGQHPNGRTVPVYLSRYFTPPSDDIANNGHRLASHQDFNNGWTRNGQHHKLCGDVFRSPYPPQKETWETLLSISTPLTRLPPIVIDCVTALIALRAQPGGWFNITGVGSGYGTLAQAGVYREGGDDERSFGVGDMDVVDLLGYAVVRYANKSTTSGAAGGGRGVAGRCGLVSRSMGGENPDVPS
ncbi:hypothetical protein F4810DRAFT_708984 [Camillea tinctor]|nr:hypothetical protein F4810DRAFT_708984 [Camillea tinctor]